MRRQIGVDGSPRAAHAGAMDPTWLFLSALFSLIGMAVFTYGRRQRTATHTVIGLALMGYPYFVSGLLPLVGVGLALLVGMVIGNRIESD
jgi:hypothetical protein